MKNRTYRFAKFELNFAEGELRTRQFDRPLAGKTAASAERVAGSPPAFGHSRRTAGTACGTAGPSWTMSRGINVAAKKVRDALGDSAEHPRYMETVARKGYRLLVPVEVIARNVDATAIEEPRLVAVTAAAPEPIANGGRTGSLRWIFPAVAVGILCILGLGLSHIPMRPHHAAPIRSLAVLAASESVRRSRTGNTSRRGLRKT